MKAQRFWTSSGEEGMGGERAWCICVSARCMCNIARCMGGEQAWCTCVSAQCMGGEQAWCTCMGACPA
eukprot:841708-Pelagomonas_calceolata.AAC.1